MPSTDLYDLFLRTNCVRLTVLCEVRVTNHVTDKLRTCLPARLKKMPFRYAAVYPGSGKNKIGLDVEMNRESKRLVFMRLGWFRTTATAPTDHGKYSDLLACFGEPVSDQTAAVSAIFRYDAQQATSLFKRVEFPNQSTIFDEIIGFSGIKRDANGKMLYEMEISIGEKELRHEVTFTHAIRVTDELPYGLIETAAKISSLALKQTEGK